MKDIQNRALNCLMEGAMYAVATSLAAPLPLSMIQGVTHYIHHVFTARQSIGLSRMHRSLCNQITCIASYLMNRAVAPVNPPGGLLPSTPSTVTCEMKSKLYLVLNTRKILCIPGYWVYSSLYFLHVLLCMSDLFAVLP